MGLLDLTEGLADSIVPLGSVCITVGQNSIDGNVHVH